MKHLFLLLACASLALAGTVSHTINLSPADVTLTEQDGFTVVGLSARPAGTNPSITAEVGSPLLPVVSGNVLIPADAELEGIAVTPLDRVELGIFRVYPAQPMRPMSLFNSVPFVEPNPVVYSSDAAYPAKTLDPIPAGSKAGFRIAGFLYCPFEYHPASGRLSLITRSEIKVSYRTSAVVAPVLTPGQRDFIARDVAELVVNSDDISRMQPPAAEKDASELDVVMFTNAALAPNLSGIRSWLMRKGYFTEIVRVDTLSQPGRDVPEKMRNFLKAAFADRGLKYVILAGDYDKCPLRYGYLPYSTYTVPADMYFADLDGSWDANNNSRWGEMDGDSLDLFQDIYVGRLPIDDATTAATFLRKDTTYEVCPDTAYLNNGLLAHEVLWSNIDYHGGIVNKNMAIALNDYAPWEIDSMLNMPASRVTTGMNAGRHYFHFAGHGSTSAFGSTFSTSNISSLTNIAKPTIISSMACDCGWFDQSTDCLGEQFVTAANGGAVSTMLNARYGWGAPPCQGPNENMNCAFVHNFLAGMTQGKSHGVARDFLRNESFSQMTMRWAMYTNTLQGDPTMAIWRSAPQTLTVVHPDTIEATPQMLEVTVDCGDAAVQGARVAVLHLGELVGRAVSNTDGEASVPLASLGDTWTLSVSVTAQDCRLYQGTIYSTTGAAAPLVALKRARVADANARLDPYEEADVYCVVENRGSAAATSATGVLSSSSPYVTVVTPNATYGTIAAGDTAAGTAFRVSVARDCPHGHRAALSLTVTAAAESWQSDFELPVGIRNPGTGLWATIDTGDYCLSVCGNGGIGTTWWRGEGFGFIYPKARMWSASSMMHGAFMLGTDTAWVADNYYGAPNWKDCPQDFQLVESVAPVYPAELGDKEFRAAFTDGRHPSPKDLRIVHKAYGSARNVHKDFVVLEYNIHNDGTEDIEGLYGAVACDFRTIGWNVNDQYDYGGTDTLRNLAYVRSANSGETLALGIRHIYPVSAPGFANCINVATYITNGFTKAEKMQFMNGTLRQVSGTTQGNWDAMSSSGPYAIPAGDSLTLAWVLCGSRTAAQLIPVSDTAAEWYNPPVGTQEPKPVEPRATLSFPALFGDELVLSLPAAVTGPARLELFDATGRLAAAHTFDLPGDAGAIAWRPDVQPGVYLLRAFGNQAKVLKVR